MQHGFVQHSLPEIASEFEAAVRWVQTMGFPTERGRLAEYRTTIVALSRDFEQDGWGDINDPVRQDQVCTTLLEIRELISIHRGLASVPTSGATNPLAHYIKGPFSPTAESPKNSSNRARNLGFELYLNALFSYAGFNPKYGTNADLMFEYRGQPFFVEAKRPASSNSLASLIRDANKQLSHRLKLSARPHARGLIALDLTKVINPENKVMTIRGEGHLHTLMKNESELQIAALRPYWNKSRHKRVIGVLLHYRVLSNHMTSGSLNTVKWISQVKFTPDSTLDEIHE